MHAARLGHAGQIVAHEVHDHQVLGPVLDRPGQLGRHCRVRCHIAAARARALHRLGLRFASLERNEKFGAQAQQPVRSVEDHAAVAGLRCRAQRGVKADGIAREIAGERKGEVRLVDIARPDRFLQRGERLLVAAR